MHTCPMVVGLVPHVGGPVTGPGAPTVLIGSLPAARISDTLVCVGSPDTIVQGSRTVIIGGKPASRMGDKTAHGGLIVLGMPTVLIGDDGRPTGGGMQAAALKGAARNGTPFCEICGASKP